METSAIFLKWNAKRKMFEFKPDEKSNAVMLTEDQLGLALSKVKGTPQGDVLTFLIDAAKNAPDKWHDASSAKLKPGQGVIG